MIDFPLVISIVAIAIAGFFFLHSNKDTAQQGKISDKARNLRALEKTVKDLVEEMKDV